MPLSTLSTLVSGMSLVCSMLVMDASQAVPDRFIQDQFAIGFWVDPPVDANVDQSYKDIAEANFTLVLGFFHANDETKTQVQLDLCEKYGLKVLIRGPGIPASQLQEGSACWGYLVKDEPSTADFPDLRARVDEIRAARPGKLAYINLFPSYASPSQLGAPTYDEHVRRYIEEVQPDVLSMDHYPIFKPDEDGRDNYCKDLGTMRKYSLQAGIPFWNFFNVMPYGPHTDPTESQLRWQIYSSLAYGAKGILYFCYYTPEGDEFPKGGAIIHVGGRKSRHYEQAKRINAEVKALGPTLMKLTSTGVYRIDGTLDPRGILAGTGIKNISRDPVDPQLNYLIGAFTHQDGRRAVLLNNYHFAYSAWPTVEFDADPALVREVSREDGVERPVIDDSPNMPGIQISLDAGEGRLFLMP